MRLSYVVFHVSDLPASLRFYRDGLGLETEHDSARFVRLCTPGAGPAECLLGLHATSDPSSVTRGANVHFDVDDLDAAVRACAARGLHFADPPRTEPWGARTVRNADPDGNSVELVQWQAM